MTGGSSRMTANVVVPPLTLVVLSSDLQAAAHILMCPRILPRLARMKVFCADRFIKCELVDYIAIIYRYIFPSIIFTVEFYLSALKRWLIRKSVDNQ